MDRVVRVHSDVLAACEECNALLDASLDVDQKVRHYLEQHGYVRIREHTQTIPAQWGMSRDTRIVVLGRPGPK
jgi:hypothetical protein